MESEFIEWLQDELPSAEHLSVPVGDDAAVLKVPPGMQLVAAADALLDGVHFDLAQHSPRLIGRKSLAVNLSDLAAMGATPMSALVTLALPRPAEVAAEISRAVLQGMAELAGEFAGDFEFSICGGDTNCWDRPLTVSVTALGIVAEGRVWRRSGGSVGDRLVVTGPLGGSILGRHLSFTPLVREAMQWSKEYKIQAATDISDGLAIDAANIARACQCGAALALDEVPISDDARRLSQQSGRDALQHALSDGEDFQLILAMRPDQASQFCLTNPAARDVGFLHAQEGLWAERGGRLAPLPASGYRHA